MEMEVNLISLILSRYRQDSGYPQTPSSNTNGFASGISVYSKPLDTTTGTPWVGNPTLVQNQDTAPRQTSRSTDPTLTTYPTFNTATFIVFLVIVGAIWFFGRG